MLNKLEIKAGVSAANRKTGHLFDVLAVAEKSLVANDVDGFIGWPIIVVCYKGQNTDNVFYLPLNKFDENFLILKDY